MGTQPSKVGCTGNLELLCLHAKEILSGSYLPWVQPLVDQSKTGPKVGEILRDKIISGMKRKKVVPDS